MVYGYARVSTKAQAREGNSLAEQTQQLTQAGAQRIFCDIFTGTQMDRPKLKELLTCLHPGDSLIVTKLDRLGRSVSQASSLITELIEKGVTIHVLNLGILSNDSVSTLLRNVLLSFAQFERDMILQRTQEGKAIARKCKPDYRDGRPRKWSDDQLSVALQLLEHHSYQQVSDLTGISRATLYRAKRKSLPLHSS